MIHYIKIFSLLFCLTLTCQSKADSWRDPSWKEMLDSSDVIALIEYTDEGKFSAPAKILTLYKGALKVGDEIWISGFSNQYGPVDPVSKSDQFLVFLYFDKPTPRGLAYMDKELEKNPGLKSSVEAYKNNKFYNVWSPTSGDLKIKDKKVQYNLTQTSFYKTQDYYSLKEFEQFLNAYYTISNRASLYKELLLEIKTASENEINSQYLMQLYFLNYNQYHPVFDLYTKVKNPTTKYALAQLMGNIHSEASRKILIALLDDKNSIVQGEAVRQLKEAPAEVVGPILLQHLKTSSEANFGPGNLMDPLTNRIDGGKVEIIKTLGEMQYKPAIPDLLFMLDTDNEELFTLVIEVLKSMGSKDYIPSINRQLDNKNYKLIHEISSLITNDSLVECLPSFKNFISTCNRNNHPSYEFTLSTYNGIAHFKDSSIISFLLSDYQHFFSYMDTLDNDKQRDWTNEYIETFTQLKVKEAQSLIYRSVFDWHGLNEDFGKNPTLYKIKKRLEDSVQASFEKELAKKDLKMTHCMAFIENTEALAKGASPKAKFFIQVTIPTSVVSEGKLYQSMIAAALHLPEESVFLKFNDGVYYNTIQNRFDKSISHTPLYHFIDYAKTISTPEDLLFLQSLLDNQFISDSYEQKKVRAAIEFIKSSSGK